MPQACARARQLPEEVGPALALGAAAATTHAWCIAVGCPRRLCHDMKIREAV